MPPSSLNELVNRYHVHWDVWPEYAYDGRDRKQIGYRLELSGSHEHGAAHPEPACEECRKIYDGLRQIAEELRRETSDEGIAATEENRCVYEIESYDQGIHYSGRGATRPQVVLTIRILLASDFDRQIDPAETQCLEAARQRLEALGVQQNR